MKRIFPVITILISFSLLGLIFFQVLWLTTARETKEKQLKENIFLATTEAAEKLMEDRNEFFIKNRPSPRFLQSHKIGMEILRPTVAHRFTKDEIYGVIRQSMDKHFLENISFEFAVSDNTLTGDQVQSDNFFSFFIDSTQNTNVAIPLEPSINSPFEPLNKEEFLVVIVPHQNQIIFKEIVWFVLGAILFTLIITTAFFLTIRALLRQKKLSEIKSDFINNMTHEFKTPLATISLAVDALKNEKVASNPEKSNYFTRVIKEENIRMNKQVETILQAALLDNQAVRLNLKKTSAHQLIQQAINNLSLALEEKKGQLQLSLQATQYTILADEVHFVNLLNNLLDNAVKYAKSDEPLLVKINTLVSGNQLCIKIEDNGIGMTRETLSRIFEKFYRAHTGNLHNVKGFGLGLSYVKTIVNAHHGTIKADSSLGKGSCFKICLPLAT